MRINLLFFVFILAGCSTIGGVGNWEYKVADYSGYARVPSIELSTLIRRAEANFRESPAYPDDQVRPISLLRAGRRADGSTLIEFSIGAVADTTAIYLFDSGGRIVDRHLRSSWDPIISTPAAGSVAYRSAAKRTRAFVTP